MSGPYRVGINGAPIGVPFPVAATPPFESNPSIAYNAAQDEFFVVYGAGVGVVSAKGQRIKPGTGALIGEPIILGSGPSIATTGVTYNPTSGRTSRRGVRARQA